ncbi:LA_2272 family surface repeat-containing protein [Polyangium aurulentum]|uniref:LA_2272 family surface repeat-containing protein n=1 Tax=Polyangium aurulentum TaxID=2567896 RepID=UPI0010ADADB5|nr:hypothetical protein [Polyangium aurulentum]UQA56677.1 hypothetical protein E8A73_036040 [Polyangium aurulentum]
MRVRTGFSRLFRWASAGAAALALGAFCARPAGAQVPPADPATPEKRAPTPPETPAETGGPAPLEVPALPPAPAPPAPVESNAPEPPPEPLVVRYLPVNVGLLHPMALNASDPDAFTHLDVSLLLGRVGFVSGAQIGPVGWVGHDLQGVQLGLAGVVEGTTEGLVLDGIFSIAGGPVTGAQVAGVLGWASDRVRGVALAGVAQQAYGDVDGLLLAGVVSVARGRVRGAQIAGGVNIGRVDGVQIGIINVSAEVNGLQLGVLNVARKLHGLQVGLLNVTDKLEGESLGVAPIPRRGGVHPVIWGSSTLFANLGVKFASRYAYSILGVALSNRAKVNEEGRQAVFAAGLSLGARVPVAPGFFVAGDVGGYRLFAGETPLAGRDELYKVRALAAFEIDPRLTPFLGGGVALSVRGTEDVATSFAPELCAGIEL